MAKGASILGWMVWQATSMQAARPRPPNPRPHGQPVADGAAAAVLGWLVQRPSRLTWWSLHEIIAGTGRSAKACSWAVIYLARHGYVDRQRDVSHKRYLRYRATAAAIELCRGGVK